MPAHRIIPCLDVRDGVVVKGVRFRDHAVVGGIAELARRYRDQDADELVLYDITASVENRSVSTGWIRDVARILDIPFTVAGGVRTLEQAAERLENGADKISINSPALERPALIGELAKRFGSQCVVVGVDSLFRDGEHIVCQYTGSPEAMRPAERHTSSWVREAQERGAGEIVLNCMNEDGRRQGYDIAQLGAIRADLHIPLIASGGAGTMEHFSDLFRQTGVSGALAASVFHNNVFSIPQLKAYLLSCEIEVRR